MKRTIICILAAILTGMACVSGMKRYDEYLRDDKKGGCKPGCTAFVGDSNVELGDWRRSLTGDVCNRGFRGYQTADLLREIDALRSLRPGAIIMLVGGNDLLTQKTPSAVADTYRLLITRYRAITPRVYCVSALPVAWRTAPHITNERILELNGRIESLCGELGAVFVNVYPVLFSRRNGLKPECALDMVHLNRRGQDIVGAMVKAAMRN